MPSLRGLIETLSLFLPARDGESGPAMTTDDPALRDLPAAEWIPRAAIVIGMVRGSPIAGQGVTEGRIVEIADLPPAERAARLQVLIEEQRSLRSHRGFLGAGR